jgi:anaerobic dimethyl sulfoxide reductase subunit B (iron-sulfur subunit)
VLWRRVYEVAGGEWAQQSSAWTSTVFAYNVSLACNHCEHAKCAGVCPVDAYTVRDDGIVLLDSSKCIGCGYCSWACPYGVPQYDRAAGYMSKCNFCFDNIDSGLPPACTAACPMRALEWVDVVAGELPSGHIPLWEVPASDHPFPLPNFSRTEPHTAIKPHPAMYLALEKHIANQEEIKPQRRSGWEEVPLVLFTLLAQVAVGGFWAIFPVFASFWTVVQADSPWLGMIPVLAMVTCLGLAMLASFSHLGTRRNAWRAVFHLKKSWLSREILYALLFGAALLATALAQLLSARLPAVLLSWLAALLGLGLLYSMTQVYHLRAVPAWNTWRTDLSFWTSALLLGPLLMASIFSWTCSLAGTPVSPVAWRVIGAWALIFLLIRAFVVAPPGAGKSVVQLWSMLLLVSIPVVAAIYLVPLVTAWWGALCTFLLVLFMEALARWLFYEARHAGPPGMVSIPA